MRADTANIDRMRRVKVNGQWKFVDTLEVKLRKIQKTTDVNKFHGIVLPTPSLYRPVPKAIISANASQVVLASSGIAVAGSFADTIDDAGFTHVPTQNSTVIYWDGTNQSRRIVRRRADGFKQPLPPGHLAITNLPMGAEGAPGPTYLLYPYGIPGACNIGWVVGDVGTPKFCHLKATNDAAHQQRILGREPISDGAMAIQLLPVQPPAPPPDPTLPPPDPPPPPAPAPVTDPTAPPTYTPPPVPPGGTTYCVMLGTEIVPIGDSPWWTEEVQQNEWVQVITNLRQLTGVPEHIMVTGRAGYTEMRDIRKGDLVITCWGEEKVERTSYFKRPGIKVNLHMEWGHLAWFNGFLGHNLKKSNPDSLL
jgi:hypothetical protein